MPRVHPFLLRSADANAARLPCLRSQAGVRCMRSFHNTRYMSSRCVFSCVPQARRCRGYTLFYFARRMQMLRACPAFACKRVEWFLGGFPLRLFLACRKRGDAAGTPFFASLGGCKCCALAPPLLASGCALHEVTSQHNIHEFPLRLFLACRKRGDAAGTPFFASLGGCKCCALAPPLLASGCALHEVISQHKIHEFPLRLFLAVRLRVRGQAENLGEGGGKKFQKHIDTVSERC